MKMTNTYVLIKPDETPEDVIAEICDDCGVRPDEHFAFSAIMLPDKSNPEYDKLKINCIIPQEDNPYTVEELIYTLYDAMLPTKKVVYVQPPIEQWLELFKPFLTSLVTKAHSQYENIIPDKEELMSILYLTVMKLHHKGFYLHKTLVQKSFINSINMECRQLKNLSLTDSLNAPIGEDDDGKPLTLLDQLADADSDERMRNDLEYTEKDYFNSLYERVKARMLEDMSEFQFQRILLQLKTHTTDRSTWYKLDKYRQIFNPGYIPRPNARGKSKGGKKK